jgi:hypothetical protein
MSPLPLRVALASAAIAISASSAAAQPTPSTAGSTYEYAVKFLCGKTGGPYFAPGTYFTAISVHNPTADVAAVAKKFALELPDEKPGPISKFFVVRLRPDEAMAIECVNIRHHLQIPSAFVTGFAVIRSRGPLDVVAVYTTASAATADIRTMEIERVQPRITSPG